MNVIERESTPNELILAPRDVMTAENAPLLLTRSAQRTSVVVRYSRIERWDVIEAPRRRVSVGARPKQLGFAALGGVGLGAFIVMALSGAPGGQAQVADASVAVSLPAQGPATPQLAPAPVAARAAPLREVQKVSAAAIVPVVSTVAATPAAAVTPSGPETEGAALAQAFSSNEAVSWRGAANYGTVVVGAATIENGKYCRDVAILTRGDTAADRTSNSRKCLEPGGRITDQALATPQ